MLVSACHRVEWNTFPLLLSVDSSTLCKMLAPLQAQRCMPQRKKLHHICSRLKRMGDLFFYFPFYLLTMGDESHRLELEHIWAILSKYFANFFYDFAIAKVCAFGCVTHLLFINQSGSSTSRKVGKTCTSEKKRKTKKAREFESLSRRIHVICAI